ncbi:hypothetical protein [Lachnoclostridium phytofermentans]|uniref:hypothetical protein n=1 Tax=Lachnoclostridium phytofermentans TaxID=66219 RepID=UPI000497026F|nr:hypothetical protein [Lachnoclostridium phytofermentans]
MAFALEKEMTPKMKDNVKEFLFKAISYQDDFIIAEELPVYYRMIDLVVAIIQDDEISSLLDSEYEKEFKYLDNNTLDILALFSIFDEVTVNKVQKHIFMDRDKIVNCFEVLEKKNLILKISRMKYTATNWRELVPKEIIALELKLQKWQEALEQAIFNKSFSDYSFVVLDKERVTKNNNMKEEYKRNNIGLILLDETGGFEIINIPKKNRGIQPNVYSYEKTRILKDVVNGYKWKKIGGRC